MKKQKVLLGMSGGVDSSVSAVLLLAAGYDVIGAFMKNWSGSVCDTSKNGDEISYIRKNIPSNDESFEECGWKVERRDAMRVAAKLGIPFVTFDFEDEYREKVVENMFQEFQAFRTPNPDVLCNKFIKFDRFVQEADRLGCDFVATGHYARVKPSHLQPTIRPSQAHRRGTTYNLFSGLDTNKDQSYFLWAIHPSILPRVLFPIGEMTKPDVRERARKAGLEVADKKDSVGICFVGEVEMREFLQQRLPKDSGNVVTAEGKVIGTHEGLAFYTIGQREGLGIGGGEPYYVIEKRPQTKELVVGSNFHPALFKSNLTASQLNWFHKPDFPFQCNARIRYRQPLQPCEIFPPARGPFGSELTVDEWINGGGSDGIVVKFRNPQRAVTPGQSIVFYDGDEVLGGGIID